jgi:hypothetical protein
MSEAKNKLREMRDEVDDEVIAIEVSIDQVQDQIDELTDQAGAISEAMMDPAASALEQYLGGKALPFEYPALTFEGFWETGQSYVVNDVTTILSDTTSGNYTCILGHTSSSGNKPGTGASWTTYWVLSTPLVTFSLYIGPDYDSLNLTDWAVLDATAVPVYEYLGTGWDGDATIIQYQDDWDFGCDYLNHPLGVVPTGPACVMRVAPTAVASYGIIPNTDALTSAKTILTNNQTKIDDSKATFSRYLED